MPAKDQPPSDGVRVQAPLHPVAQLQGPFEESMVESANDFLESEVPSDSVTRRTMLLDAPTYERVIAGRWKQKPGEKYHPLWKLIAQISFGMHLLAQNAAKSEGEVVRILQTHVDDIDTFLERTTEDFDLALTDIHERLQCLNLPLKHVEVFDRMLEDRTFRSSILEGNRKIDHIVDRTKRAAKDALKDVRKGIDGTELLEKYLTGLERTWKRHHTEHEAVFVAMQGNVEGWNRAFSELRQQGHELSGKIKQLAAVMADVEQRAVVASRRQTAAAGIPTQRNTHHPVRVVDIRSSVQSPPKPLPEEPVPHFTQRTSSRMPIDNDMRLQSRGFSSQPGSGAYRMSSMSPIPVSTVSPPRQSQRHSSRETAAELSASDPRSGILDHRARKDDGAEKFEDSASSIYYPKPLKDILNSPTPPQINLTPVSSVTHLQSDFVNTRAETPLLGQYPERGRSPAGRPSNNNQTRDPEVSKHKSPRISDLTTVEHPDKSQDPAASQPHPSSGTLLAFTSHPAVMAMASEPVELPTESLSPNLQSIPTAIYELGPISPTHIPAGYTSMEPRIQGLVELAADSTYMDNTTTMMTHRQRIPRKPVAANSPKSQSSATFELEAADSILLSSKAYTPQRDESTASMSELPANVFASPSDIKAANTRQPILVQPVSNTSHTPDGAYDHGILQGSTSTQPPSLPEGLAVVDKRQSPGKAEPAVDNSSERPVTSTSRKGSTDPSSPPKRFNFEESLLAGNQAPRKLKLARKDGKLVAIDINDRHTSMVQDPYKQDDEEDEQLPHPALSTEVVANLLDKITHTPPGSPSHTRSESIASSFSGQIRSERSSRSMGSAGAAPPPPGPGGRSLNLHEYATAGVFEGERKRSNRSENGRAWKSLLGGSTSSLSGNGTVAGSGNGSRVYGSGVVSPSRTGTSHSESISGRTISHATSPSTASISTTQTGFIPLELDSVYVTGSNTRWLGSITSLPETSRV